MQSFSMWAKTVIRGNVALGVLDRERGELISALGPDEGALLRASARSVHRRPFVLDGFRVRGFNEVRSGMTPRLGFARTVWIDDGHLEICHPLDAFPNLALLAVLPRTERIGFALGFTAHAAMAARDRLGAAASPAPAPIGAGRPPSGVFHRTNPGCARVEAVAGLLLDALSSHPAETGVIEIGEADRPVGAVFVEDGRVCWAMARGMARRLSTLLAERIDDPTIRAKLDRLYVECRRRGRNFGELVVARGVISAEGLRAALQQHTVECLDVLSREPIRGWRFRSHARRYDARFTFRPVELVAGLAALGAEGLAGAGRAAIEALPDADVPALAFAIGGRTVSPCPIAVRHPERISSQAAFEVGAWLAEASTGEPPAEVLVAGDARARSLVALRRGSAWVVALCASQAETGRVLSYSESRARTQKTMGLSVSSDAPRSFQENDATTSGRST